MSGQAEPLSILCFGAGAIGTYVGGSLALSGCRVVFIERPDLADKLRQSGLRLGLVEGEWVIENPEIAASLGEAFAAGPFDAVLLAIKSFDTAGLISEILPYKDQIPPILCLQNGVDNEPALEAALGGEKVIPGTVTTAIGRRGAGDIKVEKLRGLGVYAGHPLSARLVSVLERAGLKPRAIPDAAAMKWSKMLTNLIANASSAILDMTPGEIFADPRLFAMEIRMLRETLAVMDRKAISVVDLPGTPVRALAWAIRHLPLWISRPLLAKAVGGGRGGKMPSFHIDLHAGRGQSEVDYLNGAVVRTGREVGVKTPVNEVLTQTLLELTRGKMDLSEFAHRPEKLLQLVSRGDAESEKNN
jgi:2-dehydropantoate 2-reductase